MSILPEIPEEIKTELKTEKERVNSRARRFLRLHNRYKRNVIVLSGEIIAFIPFFVYIWYSGASISFLFDSTELTFLFYCSYMLLAYVLGIFFFRRRLNDTCKLLCFYTAISAAEEFDNENLVMGSYYLKKMFKFIKKYSEEEAVSIDSIKIKIKDLFTGPIEKLHEQREAVSKAILENNVLRTQFSNQLYFLAKSLFSDKYGNNFDEANRALNFIKVNSEPYFEPSTYLQKHKKTNSIVKVLSEIGKIVLVPILLFILWSIFGYGG